MEVKNSYIRWSHFISVMSLSLVVVIGIFSVLYTQQVALNRELEVYKEQSFREIAEIRLTVGIIDANVENIKSDVKEIKELIVQ